MGRETMTLKYEDLTNKRRRFPRVADLWVTVGTIAECRGSSSVPALSNLQMIFQSSCFYVSIAQVPT